MKAESEGRRQNEECRSGEKLGSGIRAQPLGCRGLRQLWRTRERRQIVESPVTVPREVLRTVYVRRVVEGEGVIKFLTVRCCARPLGGMQKANVHAAAFSHFCHFCHVEPSSGWVGCRRGEETAPCMGCLRRLPPEGGVPGSREETAPGLAVRGGEAGARAGLASAGRSADAPACGQAVGSRLARTKLDLDRAGWIRGGSERMNGNAKGLSDRKTTPGQGTRPTLQGQAKDLSDRNTCFIYRSEERGSGIKAKCSLIFGYVRLCSLNWKKMFGAPGGGGRAIVHNARQTEIGTLGTLTSD